MEETPSKPKPSQVSRKFNAKALRLSLKYRPKIYRLILKLRLCIREKNNVIKELKNRLAELDKSSENRSSESLLPQLSVKKDSKDCHTQTTEKADTKENVTKVDNENPMWGDGGADKSIADQVKEVAQSALQQNGMVYVESAGMYYDYKTGYYYNSELGLYYHNDTGCYYYYSEDQKNFVFHSYPDRNALAANASLIAHEKKKARKQMKERKAVDSVKELTKSLSKGKDELKPSKAKKRKMTKKRAKSDDKGKQSTQKVAEDSGKDAENSGKDVEDSDRVENEKPEISNNGADLEASSETKEQEIVMEVDEELEDGECSDTQSEEGDDEDGGGEEGEGEEGEESDASTSTVSDDDVISKHHPPCMRVVVRESALPRLRVGTLFLVTKDGGSLGREGDHAVLIPDTNVSRKHLELRYEAALRSYTATDLGSKNGTVLNGQRMSDSLVPSQPMQVMHGSVIQVGETKLLCHVHAGSDTCGHCEPGLLMEAEEKQQKSAYTRTCSKEKQHQLELARLRNKYAPQPLMIEEREYRDRAEQRRRQHGSSHSAEKTQAGDLDTEIAADNKGFKLLQKMGWAKGEGLGKEGQGNPEPIPLVSNEGKAGLGTAGAVGPPGAAPPAPRGPPRARLGPATMRLAAATKMLQPPAKAFQLDDDDDDDEGQ